MRVSAQTVRKEYSSDRDRRTQYEAAVTTDLSTESGTILLNGLLKDAPLCFRPTCRHAWTRLCYRTTPETQFLTCLTRIPRARYF